MVVLTDNVLPKASPGVAPERKSIIERIPFDLEMAFRPLSTVVASKPSREEVAETAVSRYMEELPAYPLLIADTLVYERAKRSLLEEVIRRTEPEGLPGFNEAVHRMFRNSLNRFLDSLDDEDRNELVSIADAEAPDDIPHTPESAVIVILNCRRDGFEIRISGQDEAA